MGTASSNRGPSGTGNLLPTWYDNGIDNSEVPQSDSPLPGYPDQTGQPVPDTNQIPQNATQPPPVTGNWKTAKGAITRYSRRTAGSGLSKAIKSYLKVLGGSRAATQSSSRGIVAGNGLANFLGAVSSGGVGIGLNQKLTDLGLANCIGQPSEFVLAKIADAIAPTGATNDEAIARDAVLATLDQLYSTIILNEGDLTSLESLTPEMIKDAVIEYISCFIYKKWVYELGLALEKNGVTENAAIAMEIEIKDFIQEEVRVGIQNQTIQELDLHSANNQLIIESIFQLAFSTLER